MQDLLSPDKPKDSERASEFELCYDVVENDIFKQTQKGIQQNIPKNLSDEEKNALQISVIQNDQSQIASVLGSYMGNDNTSLILSSYKTSFYKKHQENNKVIS